MKVLSLFDGMACGMLAMQAAGIEVDRYVAYEIGKYAVKVASHNFPYIEQRGDVFQADFAEFNGFDWLIGGSPCTYWSIAQKNNRETEASGLGWELFSQYVRALHEARPKYFLYENNKSMSKEIRASITEAFGFEPVLINSALVSAQNRQRLYWVGRKNEDGTYSRVDVEQPDDRGILLRDVLDSAYPYRQTETEKGYCLDANYWKTPGSPETFLIGGHARANRTMVAEPVEQGNARYLLKNLKYADEKTGTLTACCYKGIGADGMYTVAEPVCVAQRGRYAESGEIIQHYEPREDGKTNAITTVQKDNAIAEPVRVGTKPNLKGEMVDCQSMRIYSVDGASRNLTAGNGGNGTQTGLYAVPINGRYVATNAIRAKGALPIYKVRNGLITIKDKQYPIKLADGFYIIRKLTVSECMRLQTVPEWYDFSVISNSQAYKCLGNGWTVEVIAHLINATKEVI